MFKQFIETLRENFKKRLQQKTDWPLFSRNEVMQQFEKALVETIVELVDESLFKSALLIENKNEEE